MNKKQLDEQNKQLQYILIGISILVLLVFGGYYFSQSRLNFNYEGIDFKTVSMGSLVFYEATFPIWYYGEPVEYSYYLRGNPKKTAKEVKLEISGNLNFLPVAIINSSSEFNCNGDGSISVGNLQKVLEIRGTTLQVNQSLGCSENSDYMYLYLTEGEENEIKEISPFCYELRINDCEILKVTERFDLEVLKEIYSRL